MFSVAGRIIAIRTRRRIQQVELVVGLLRAFRARQLFENRVQFHLGVVDLCRQRVTLGRERIAFVAQFREFRADRVRFRALLRDLLLEREPFRVIALVQRNQTANILR
jgi:hypothetical protein